MTTPIKIAHLNFRYNQKGQAHDKEYPITVRYPSDRLYLEEYTSAPINISQMTKLLWTMVFHTPMKHMETKLQCTRLRIMLYVNGKRIINADQNQLFYALERATRELNPAAQNPFAWSAKPSSTIGAELQRSKAMSDRTARDLDAPSNFKLTGPRTKEKTINQMFGIKNRFNFGQD